MSQILLQELTNSDLDWLIAAGKRQIVAADCLLIETERQISDIYLVVSGSLQISIPQNGDRALNRAFALLEDRSTLERDIIELERGDVAGLEFLVGSRAASTNVRTKVESDLLSIPLRSLQGKLQQDIGFAARFYRGIALMLTERLLKLTTRLRTARLSTTGTASREVLFAFGQFLDSDLDWLIANGSCQYLPPGSTLLQEGRPAETLYMLLKGSAKVTIAETAIDPLDLAFTALGTSDRQNANKEIATVRAGEFIGEMPFGENRLASTSVRTVEDSLVLAIPERSLRLKLQQDYGWAARFEAVVATLAVERFRDTVSRLGYGRNFDSRNLEHSSDEDELNPASLDNTKSDYQNMYNIRNNNTKVSNAKKSLFSEAF